MGPRLLILPGLVAPQLQNCPKCGVSPFSDPLSKQEAQRGLCSVGADVGNRHQQSAGCGASCDEFCRLLLQGLGQILDQILGVFDAAGQTDHVVGNAYGTTLLGGEIMVTHHHRLLDQ